MLWSKHQEVTAPCFWRSMLPILALMKHHGSCSSIQMKLILAIWPPGMQRKHGVCMCQGSILAHHFVSQVECGQPSQFQFEPSGSIAAWIHLWSPTGPTTPIRCSSPMPKWHQLQAVVQNWIYDPGWRSTEILLVIQRRQCHQVLYVVSKQWIHHCHHQPHPPGRGWGFQQCCLPTHQVEPACPVLRCWHITFMGQVDSQEKHLQCQWFSIAATGHRFSPWRDGPFTQHIASTLFTTLQAIYAWLVALLLCQWHYEHCLVFDLPEIAATHANLDRDGNILHLLDFTTFTAVLQGPTSFQCQKGGIFQSSWEVQMQWSWDVDTFANCHLLHTDHLLTSWHCNPWMHSIPADG